MEEYCTLRCFTLTLVGVISLLPLVAGATAQRTFVASNGNDAGPCSLGQPCRSFAAAIANTNAGGEVIVLDSAGYGKVTITQAVSIIAPPGIYAGISVFAGDDGIVIETAANDKVTLRGLTINGQGGNRGIFYFGGGGLEVDRCIVSGMASHGVFIGPSATGSTTIGDSVIERNAGGGIDVEGSGSLLLASVRAANNGATGIFISNGNDVHIRNSVFHHNGSAGVAVSAGIGNPVLLDMTGSEVSDNGQSGIEVTSFSTAVIQALLSNNTITNHPQNGISIFSNPGAAGVHAVVTRNVVRGFATAIGIAVSNPSTEVLLEDNVVSQTSVGVKVQNSAIVHSRGDNMVDDNTTNQSGSVTPANAL